MAIPATLTEHELENTLLFYRRRLAENIIVAMIKAAPNGYLRGVFEDPATVAEGLANEIAERLAARETGRPTGYGK